MKITNSFNQLSKFIFFIALLSSFSLKAQHTNIINTNINYKLIISHVYYSGTGDNTSEGEPVFKFNYYDHLAKKSTNTCWSEVKSPNVSTPWEHSLFFTVAEGKNAPYDTQFSLELEAMEDDDGNRCNYDPAVDQDYQKLQAQFKGNYDRLKYTKGDIPGEYLYIGDYTYSYMFGDKDGSLWNALGRMAYRYTGGNTCADPLRFGNVISGLTYNHTNALTAITGDPNLDYTSSNIGVETTNDIVYSFELDYTANVNFSLKSNTENTNVLFSLVEHDDNVSNCNYDDYIIEGTSTVSGNLNKTEQLCAGLYYVVIEGKSANKGNFTLEITPTKIADELTLTISNLKDAKCNEGSTGTANIHLGGGKPEIYYSITPNGGSYYYNVTGLNFYEALEPATYTIYARDFLDCDVSKTFTIGAPAAITSSEEVTQPISCFGESDASLTITPSGGSGSGYSLVFDGSSSSFNINNLEAGTYDYTVYDSEDCPQEKSIAISQPDPITIEGASNNGDIEISVSGGNENYEYLWSNGAGTQNVYGLNSGFYTVEVEDDKGCMKDKVFEVVNPITGLIDQEENAFLFYTTVNNEVVITLPDNETYQYRITDLTGNTKKSGTLTTTTSKINLEEMTNSVYLISVYNDSVFMTKKLMKK